MNCPHCQQPIAVGAKFCGACGAALQPSGQPAPQPAPPVWTAPARAASSGRSPSAFVLMMAGLGLGLLSLLFAWAPTTSYYAKTYSLYELNYSDGTNAQREYLPGIRQTGTGGGDAEAKVLATVILLAAGGGALYFRSRPWPRWGLYVLLGLSAFLVIAGLSNGLYHGTFGPFVLVLGALGLGAGAMQNLVSTRRTV